MSLDPTSNIGIVRLRIADYSDIPLLSDSVIQSVLEANSNNLANTIRINVD